MTHNANTAPNAQGMDRRAFMQGAAAMAAAASVPSMAHAKSASTGAQQGAVMDGIAWAQQIRRGDVTPLEALEAAIARVEALPKLNVVVIKDYELARGHARQMSALGAAARASAAEKAPLWGVPFLLKDLNQYVKGTVTTNGCVFYKGAVAQYTSTLAERYQQAGLNIFGKTASPEFGQTPTTESRLYGKTPNPWNAEHTTGGSSGGAAAVVAAGILPVAHASDGGGSIRIPASHCGIFGLKPSRGRLPAGPMAMEGWMGMSMNHVVSRTVRDSAHVLDLTSGAEPGSRVWAPRDVQGSYVQVMERPLKKLRIAVWRKNHFNLPVDPQCLMALDKAIKACTALGHEVVEDMPELPVMEMFTGMGVVTGVGLITSVKAREKQLGREVREAELEPLDWLAYQKAKGYSAEQMFNACTVFDSAGRTLDVFFKQYDLILTPVTAVPPQRLGVLALDQPYESFAAAAIHAAPYTGIFNMTGLPAMSVPMHQTPERLPVGAHFAAPYGYEGRLFNLAAQLEQAVPWAHKLPDLSIFKA
ncbi:amidase [Comamonas sp. lk]|uniref:amidase n=1 Tax=Comamonas sp. lk TaxID=2201272 RepID=UPI000EAE1F08|nr:amidase [Comamonas sp. lk]